MVQSSTIIFLVVILSACAMTQPKPPGPEPDKPAFVCGNCDGTMCKPRWVGKQCKSGEDEQGRFCIAQGKCIFGITLPGVAFALASESLLPPKDEAALAAEERINRYFRTEVIPRLRPCWKRMRASGVVTILHNYIRRSGGPWIPHSLRAVHSTLSGVENEIAVDCMKQAVQDTSISPEKLDDNDVELALIWAWPVPFAE